MDIEEEILYSCLSSPSVGTAHLNVGLVVVEYGLLLLLLRCWLGWCYG